jgi:hypothetical protein
VPGHLNLEQEWEQLEAIQVVLEAATRKQHKDSARQDFVSAALHYSFQRKVLQAGLRVARSQ